ncbi:hypothetical protein CR513_21966, partial [Mucuna pruriens]
MVGWMVELSKFDLIFKKLGHVKDQVLANFIVELTLTGEVEKPSKGWTLSAKYEALLTGMRLIEETIVTFLLTREAPNDPLAAKKLKKEASKYTLITQQLYIRGFS